ncbi:MAG: tRNA-binding protein [Flavipsychrobacter sp.]|jgi:tRNA-binding protein|nr:tRNA-binding protein [Flavipsychrobacter sp.]
MLISWSDFEKIDIRVGTILDAQDFPEAKKAAFQLVIDFGDAGIKKSSAQITGLYSIEELRGRQIIAILNFPPKKIANFSSDCLVLGVYAENGDVVLLQPDRPVRNGCKIG